MSITRTTFNASGPAYTVVGGESRWDAGHEPEISVILLNRSGKFYRDEYLSLLDTSETVQVLYIEGPGHSYDIEPLSKKFPSVKFLLFQDEVTPGGRISVAINESAASLCFVLWSDMRIMELPFPQKFFECIRAANVFCTVPEIKNARYEYVPSIMTPGILKNHLQILPFGPHRDGCPSIFPFDYCGMYQREKYLSLGGYDESIRNPYWQKMDLGFRAFMWGEPILLAKTLAVQYTTAPVTEDATPDSSYKYFYLKNMFVAYKNAQGVLPLYRLFHYMIRSNSGPFESVREFLAMREWVRSHRDRFRRDAKTLIRSWEAPE